jgi:hypothetical protein
MNPFRAAWIVLVSATFVLPGARAASAQTSNPPPAQTPGGSIAEHKDSVGHLSFAQPAPQSARRLNQPAARSALVFAPTPDLLGRSLIAERMLAAQATPPRSSPDTLKNGGVVGALVGAASRCPTTARRGVRRWPRALAWPAWQSSRSLPRQQGSCASRRPRWWPMRRRGRCACCVCSSRRPPRQRTGRRKVEIRPRG